MKKEELISSISYCGLICKLCHLADECDGCKATGSRCPANSGRAKGCYHRNCCIRKEINGCWDCEDFPCSNEMFVGPTGGEIKGFCRCIKGDGIERFVGYIQANQERGIPYGKKGYINKNEEEVLRILRESIL